MNEWWNRTKNRWDKLELREKRIICVSIALIGFFIIYEGVWKPYLDHIAFLRKQIITDQKTLSWMQAADQAISALDTQTTEKNQTVPIVRLLGQIQKQIQQAGLGTSLMQLQQASNTTLEIQFQKVEFDKLMGLLAELNRANALSITQMSATPSGPPGIVNADILLNIGPGKGSE